MGGTDSVLIEYISYVCNIHFEVTGVGVRYPKRGAAASSNPFSTDCIELGAIISRKKKEKKELN